MMKVINDSVFGELSFDACWKREYILEFMGIERSITLVVDGDEDADFEDSQYKAFEEFEKIKAELTDEVVNRVFLYYQSVCDENRIQFSSQADELSPIIQNPQELEHILKLTDIKVIESFDEDDRIIGFLFDASWEPELGVGVECINGKVNEVGVQDIVL